MQKVFRRDIIEEKTEADQNACRIIEETKESGSKKTFWSREEAQKLIEKTCEDFKNDKSVEAIAIEQIVEADQNACRIIDEAKERGNRIILEAREEAQKLIEKANEDFKKDIEFLERQLISEGNEEAARFSIEKERYIQRIKEISSRCREQVFKELRDKLFNGL
ncbi:hypothetical protein JXL19_07445 [bacterium]|nr:hypothetical protein [bacterium]